MGILKSKDAADLLCVSQTTIKRWASTFPDCFQKDRLVTIYSRSRKLPAHSH